MNTEKRGLADTVEKRSRERILNYEPDGTGNDGCLRHAQGFEAGCEYCEYRVKKGHGKVWSDELKQRRPVQIEG